MELTGLTVDHPCGYGFWVSDPEGSAALLLEFLDREAAAERGLPENSRLPDEHWRVTVREGADLFAGWCDDERPEAREPEVTGEWVVISGTVTVTRQPEPGTVGPAVIQAHDLVAIDEAGREVVLGDIEITNERFGLFGV